MHEPETPRTWLCAGGIEPMTFGGRNDFLYIPCPRSAVYFPMLIPICETSIHRKNLRCPATYPLAPLGARPVCHDEASKYGAMKRFTPKSHNPCYFGYRTSVKVAILFACTGFRKLGVSTPMDLDTFYAVRRPGSETRKRLHIDRRGATDCLFVGILRFQLLSCGHMPPDRGAGLTEHTQTSSQFPYQILPSAQCFSYPQETNHSQLTAFKVVPLSSPA